MKKSLITISIFIMLFLGSRGVTEAINQTSGSSAMLDSQVAIDVPDHREQILKDYLNEVNSPLAPHAKSFIVSADKHNLDWKLLVSIAGLESGYGKHQPVNSHNGWGWGYNNGTVKHFASWDVAIEEISRGLREGYLKELDHSDPYVIGPTYAASPTWAVRVTYFMNKLEGFKTRNATSTLALSL